MADNWTAEQRSRMMSRVKNTDTKPEMVVRRLLHQLGFRYRLHDRKLPGSPDIILPKYKKVVFVHGCFWHGHTCSKGRRPTSKVEFWNKKLDTNIERDAKVQAQLSEAGWESLVIWECGIKNQADLTTRLIKFLGPKNTTQQQLLDAELRLQPSE